MLWHWSAELSSRVKQKMVMWWNAIKIGCLSRFLFVQVMVVSARLTGTWTSPLLSFKRPRHRVILDSWMCQKTLKSYFVLVIEMTSQPYLEMEIMLPFLHPCAFVSVCGDTAVVAIQTRSCVGPERWCSWDESCLYGCSPDAKCVCFKPLPLLIMTTLLILAC